MDKEIEGSPGENRPGCFYYGNTFWVSTMHSL